MIIPTGIELIDKGFGGGIKTGEITLIGGRPGIGKSSLATDIAINVSKQGIDVIYCNIEASKTIDARLEDAMMKDANVRNHLEIYTPFDKHIRSISDELFMSQYANVVIFDYVQLIEGLYLRNGSFEFLCKCLLPEDMAFIWCSMLPKTADDRGFPSIEDTMGVVSAFDTADKTILLHRDDYYSSEAEHGKMEAFLYKKEKAIGKAVFEWSPQIFVKPFYDAILNKEEQK